MKSLIAILFFISSYIYGQDFVLPKNENTGKVTFESVVIVDSLSSEQLYLKSRFWLSNVFVKSKNVIDLEDPINKTIIAKGNTPVIIKGNFGDEPGGYVSFKLSLFFRDGRYRYILTDFEHVYDGEKSGFGSGGALENEKPACGNFFLTKKNWQRIKQQTDVVAKGLVNSLHFEMLKKQESDKW